MKRRQWLVSIGTALGLGAPGARAQSARPGEVWVEVETPHGSFVIAVDPAVAPVTVQNFLTLVDARALDLASVYRILTRANQPEGAPKIEVVQWGINPPADKPPLLPPIRHETTRETGLRHRDGTVSMARLGPGTASTEFFICVGDQPELDFGGKRNPDGQGFAAFGQVVQGMEVVRALHKLGPPAAYLKPPVPIRRVRRIQVSRR